MYVINLLKLINKAAHPVICEDWHFTYMWETVLHHFAKRGGWVHKTSLIPPHFIEVHVSNQESEQSCWYRFCNFIIFWNCSDSVVIFVKYITWETDTCLYINVNSKDTLIETLCDKVFQWLSAGRWFSPGTPVSSTNKTVRHDITEILLKVALNTITLIETSACVVRLDITEYLLINMLITLYCSMVNTCMTSYPRFSRMHVLHLCL